MIDPRTLVPLDLETIAGERRANRPARRRAGVPGGGSWGATVVARLMTESFDAFDAPPLLVSGDDTPIPYAGVLEEAWIPSVERIKTAVRQLG